MKTKSIQLITTVIIILLTATGNMTAQSKSKKGKDKKTGKSEIVQLFNGRDL
jgi:hypothetical protein